MLESTARVGFRWLADVRLGAVSADSLVISASFTGMRPVWIAENVGFSSSG
jgi:hypothetical protein